MVHVPFDTNSSEHLGPHGSIRFITGTSGLRLCAHYWPSTAVARKGVVVLCHGHGCYAEFEFLRLKEPGLPNVYQGSVVEMFNAAGYSICAVDYRGCGRSEGVRGYIDKFDDYVDDVCTLIESLEHSTIPGFQVLPLFLLGVSLGGCVALFTAFRKTVRVQGVVLLAPMLSLEKLASRGINRFMRPVSSVISWLTPMLPIGKGSKNLMFPHLQYAWELDPLMYKGLTRARTAVEYLSACERLAHRMRQVVFPVLVYHSEQDTFTDPDGSKMLVLRAKTEDKTLRLVNDMWHVLLKEPGYERIAQEVVEWLDARLPCGKGVAQVVAPAPAG